MKGQIMDKKIIVLLSGCILAVFLLAGCGNDEVSSEYNIEYLNKDKTKIVDVPYEPEASDTDGMIKEFLAKLSSDSDNVEYRKPIPNGVEVTDYSLDGVMLSKLDGDARGGAALSVKAVTGKPIKFMGTGEKLDMIEPFHPDRMAQRILGMGDVLSFIERAEQSIDEEKAKKLEEKLKKNRFTLSDYYDQLVQLKSMGSFEQLAGMMPGQLGKQMANAELDPKMMAHTEAIILSMTPYERENPAVLGASRKKRIAAGCGLEVVDVNRLLKQFEMMQSMIKQVTRGGKMPKGMGGFGGGRMRGFGRKKRFK